MRLSPTERFDSLATPRFALSHVRSQEQLETAGSLRERVFRERRRIRFDEALEARRDREGLVFLLFDRAVPVAVGRVLPCPSRLSPMVDLKCRAAALDADSEIGRVACVANNEAPYCALLLLTLGSRWILEHTHLRRYVGYCHPKLVDSYRRLGAVPGDQVAVPGRAVAYFIITGCYEVAQNLGSRLLGLT